MPTKIFVACFPYSVICDGDVLGCALSEDGHVLAEHLSSSESFCRHDMGVTSDWQHENYRAICPDGYELVWVGSEFRTHEGWQAALAKNRASEAATQQTAERSA